MVDINARLLETTNGKGPQHKIEDENKFQFTEGSEGNLHVRDKGVKEELEFIKQELADTKQTNQQILQRLDGTFDTRLNGSNVELVAENTSIGEIPTGTSKQVLVNINLSLYSYFYIQFRPGSGNNDYNLLVYPSRAETNSPITNNKILENTGSASNIETDKIEVSSISASIYVENTMESNRTFNSIHIIGVKK